jgi:hypothetical protein
LAFLCKHLEILAWLERRVIEGADGLVGVEVNGQKVILPIWHNVNRDDVAKYYPILAGRLAVSTNTRLDDVMDEIVRAIA